VDSSVAEEDGEGESDGELVLAGWEKEKEDVKDGMGLSWVWVDSVGMTAITT
jgi:hypothetical protein